MITVVSFESKKFEKALFRKLFNTRDYVDNILILNISAMIFPDKQMYVKDDVKKVAIFAQRAAPPKPIFPYVLTLFELISDKIV